MACQEGVALMNKRVLGLFSAVTLLSPAPGRTADGLLVNDVHSQLNATPVDRVVRPASAAEVQAIVRQARKEKKSISIAGGRHAMGGQQFGEGTIHLDMSAMDRVVRFDRTKGLIEVEAGIQWPALVDYLLEAQKDQWPQWGIIQKQTGADRLSIGGALSANIHGRGLRLKPFISNVESFTLVDANGKLRVCSRTENPELFKLAIGGYGLFGVITTATLRLGRRQKLERTVKVLELKDLMPAFEQKITEGYNYGDFQYSIDLDSEDFLRKGVFSCYRPVDEKTPMPSEQKELGAQQWDRLYYMAHADKKGAFELYSTYYLSTNGQLYWSDTHQMSVYTDSYHETLDKKFGVKAKGSEMITEVYATRDSLVDFMEEVRREFREKRIPVIYGTIRLIERDDESFLAWAKDRYACVIFNLHVDHTPEGLEKAKEAFRFLIDASARHGGTYFPTYHRWATRPQVEKCYPQFTEFLRLKKKHDPQERFQSDWYRHYKKMFADVLK
jgi:FAD/FMN-containing dehydrogenase